MAYDFSEEAELTNKQLKAKKAIKNAKRECKECEKQFRALYYAAQNHVSHNTNNSFFKLSNALKDTEKVFGDDK